MEHSGHFKRSNQRCRYAVTAPLCQNDASPGSDTPTPRKPASIDLTPRLAPRAGLNATHGANFTRVRTNRRRRGPGGNAGVAILRLSSSTLPAHARARLYLMGFSSLARTGRPPRTTTGRHRLASSRKAKEPEEAP